MEVTVGALRTDISWYYFVDYIWKHVKRVVIDLEINMDLMDTDMNGERMTLSYHRYDEVAEIVGVWIAPYGN